MASVSDPGYEVFEVEQILHKGYYFVLLCVAIFFSVYKRKTVYLVKWIGYDYTENTWEPSSNLYFKDLVKDFQKWYFKFNFYQQLKNYLSNNFL
jgi:hypothetical protein